jgi:hypothetical protein
MTKETFYMVGEVGFEYNDEVYHLPESGGVTPIKLFRTEQAAEVEVAKLTMARLKKGEDLMQYCYEFREICTTYFNEAREIVEKYDANIDLRNLEYGELERVMGTFSDEDLLEFIHTLDIEFFSIIAVETE